jgi:hypothetical protein
MASEATFPATIMDAMRQQVKPRQPSQQEWNTQLYELQRRARRGPTPEIFYAKHLDNSRLAKEADPARGREIRTFAFAVGILFLLVMVYVVQRFQSIEYGYRIEAQKQLMEELSEKNRQLSLTEAQLNAPLRLDDLARGYGMDAPAPAQLARLNASSDSVPVEAKANIPASPAGNR